ncbi:MAG: DUF3025 domain-containing protein, partial [Noviherbaspirillum sp.]
MPAAFLEPIDWRRPWLASVVPAAGLILQGSDWCDALNVLACDRGLKNHRSVPLKFVPQSDLPAGMAYETFISQSGCVPTRENLHDFFNALVWLSYPRIKRQLNALQAAEIARRQASAQSSRGKLRDAATIFDENAVLLLTSDPAVHDALRRHQWRKLFIEQRKTFETCCTVHLFGHALMEKRVTPYKAITGHAWVVQVDPAILALSEIERRAWLDAKVAVQLQSGLSTS